MTIVPNSTLTDAHRRHSGVPKADQIEARIPTPRRVDYFDPRFTQLIGVRSEGGYDRYLVRFNECLIHKRLKLWVQIGGASIGQELREEHR